MWRGGHFWFFMAEIFGVNKAFLLLLTDMTILSSEKSWWNDNEQIQLRSAGRGELIITWLVHHVCRLSLSTSIFPTLIRQNLHSNIAKTVVGVIKHYELFKTCYVISWRGSGASRRVGLRGIWETKVGNYCITHCNDIFLQKKLATPIFYRNKPNHSLRHFLFFFATKKWQRR